MLIRPPAVKLRLYARMLIRPLAVKLRLYAHMLITHLAVKLSRHARIAARYREGRHADGDKASGATGGARHCWSARRSGAPLLLGQGDDDVRRAELLADARPQGQRRSCWTRERGATGVWSGWSARRSGGPCCSVRRSCWLTREHQPGRPTACIRVANSPAAPIDVALPEPTPPAAPPLSPSTACRPLDIGQRSVHAGRA